MAPEEVVDGAAMGFERARSSGGGILFLVIPCNAADGWGDVKESSESGSGCAVVETGDDDNDEDDDERSIGQGD